MCLSLFHNSQYLRGIIQSLKVVVRKVLVQITPAKWVIVVVYRQTCKWSIDTLHSIPMKRLWLRWILRARKRLHKHPASIILHMTQRKIRSESIMIKSEDLKRSQQVSHLHRQIIWSRQWMLIWKKINLTMVKHNRCWTRHKRSSKRSILLNLRSKNIHCQLIKNSRKKSDGRSSQSPRLSKDRSERGFALKLKLRKPRRPALSNLNLCLLVPRAEGALQLEADMNHFHFLKDCYMKQI